MSGTVGGGTRVRAGTGLVMAVLVLTVLWVPALYWVVDALVALLVAQGLREYCAMARAAGINVMPRATILTGVGLVLFNGLALFLWWRGMGGSPRAATTCAAWPPTSSAWPMWPASPATCS
jgi:CDP-diglyceride synthetase